jgi:hypothetical protein
MLRKHANPGLANIASVPELQWPCNPETRLRRLNVLYVRITWIHGALQAPKVTGLGQALLAKH